MTLNEFKTWLDGFSHAILAAPTKEQWELIQKKLNEVNNHSVSEPANNHPKNDSATGTWPPRYALTEAGLISCTDNKSVLWSTANYPENKSVCL